MKHMNRFGRGKEQRPRIRLRILRGYGGYGVGAIISPPTGAAQILLAKKDQLGRPVVELVIEPAAEVVTESPTRSEPAPVEAAPIEIDDDQRAPAAGKLATKRKGK